MQQTPLVLAGRSPSFSEREYWQRLHDGFRRAAMWLMVALNVFFCYNSWWYAVRMPLWDGVITACVLTPATLLVLFYVIYDHHMRQNALKTAWYNEQADKARLAAGYTVTLWDDRAVLTDLRGETTVWFQAVTLCTESVHGFYLQANEAAVLIRACDLTSEQVTEVRARLKDGISREKYRVKSTAIGGLYSPLPLPVFENDDTVTFRTETEVALPRQGAVRQKRLRMARIFGIPSGLVFGVTLAEMITVAPYYWLNLLFFCVAGVATYNVLLALLTAQRKQGKATVYVALTRDGAALFCNGQHFFYMWERVKLRETTHAAWLIFPDGGRLKIGDNYHG